MSDEAFPALTSNEEVDAFAALVWERVSDKLRHRLVVRLMGADPDAGRDARRERWIPGAPVPVPARAQRLRDEASWCWDQAEIYEASADSLAIGRAPVSEPGLMYRDMADALSRFAARFAIAANWVDEHDEGAGQ